MTTLQKIHISTTIVLALILLVIIHCGIYRRNISEDAQVAKTETVDTVVIYRVDTIVEYSVKYKDVQVKDTIYVEKDKDPFFLLVQKHFQKYGLYDMWVSGIEPLNVDSVVVYPKTEYKYITQTKNIYDNNGTDVFGSMGFGLSKGKYSSNIGIYAVTNRKWLYGAEFGLFDGSWYVGAKVGLKINNNK